MKLYQIPKLLNQSSESGFTIIEALIGLIVASILLTAIAPVLVISVATRVQARRVELATQAARTYVDGLQTKTIATVPASTTVSIDQFAVPTAGNLTCNANSYCTVPTTPAKSLYCIDGNSDSRCTNSSSQDLVIQAFRQETTDPQAGYQLGIRVYRGDAFRDSGALKKNANASNSKVTSATFTGGLGDRKAPLLETTTEINPNQPSYSSLCDRLGGCS
ncbi:MAG: hormogonium polysaccharide secretion pseudopilin HpsB [Nostochopsis sp.]